MRGWSRCHRQQAPSRCLFPAHAGVVPSASAPRSRASSLPRSCGGGPHSGTEVLTITGSSPLMRGWSGHVVDPRLGLPLFPAHAGVVPHDRERRERWRTLPRSCGGGPVDLWTLGGHRRSSPLMRGWSLHRRSEHVRGRLFPAHAGVVRCLSVLRRSPDTLPRSCGGGPNLVNSPFKGYNSSPLMRGWSVHHPAARHRGLLFPAHAGVVRPQTRSGSTDSPLPRSCGGGPLTGWPTPGWTTSSPLMRGWSPAGAAVPGAGRLFPAHAGVVRGRVRVPGAGLPLPRSCGGGPSTPARHGARSGSSPLMRGWSKYPGTSWRAEWLFPAHAGVVLTTYTARIEALALPRSCGGGPGNHQAHGPLAISSPLMRGWSERVCERCEGSCLFPAHAGVVPCSSGRWGRRRSLPRSCGGGPIPVERLVGHRRSSPLMRGWSGPHGQKKQEQES